MPLVMAKNTCQFLWEIGKCFLIEAENLNKGREAKGCSSPCPVLAQAINFYCTYIDLFYDISNIFVIINFGSSKKRDHVRHTKGGGIFFAEKKI
jgi:hypothetical protein